MSLKFGRNNIPSSPSRPIKQSFPKWFPRPNSFDFLSPNIGVTWTARFSSIWNFPGVNLNMVAHGIPFYDFTSQASDIANRYLPSTVSSVHYTCSTIAADRYICSAASADPNACTTIAADWYIFLAASADP